MSFPVPNWSGRTGFPTTSGNMEMLRHDMSHRRHHDGKRSGSDYRMCRRIMTAGILVLLSMSGCARLGPNIESGAADAQVTMDSLKSAVRDGQRMTTDLRIELADRRKELAEVHVARAQLQGILRETERRLAEARQIIELQREELEVVRTDRVRVEASGRQLHSRLRRLEKLLAQARKQRETGEVIPSGYAPRPSAELIQPLHVSPPASPVAVQPAMATDIEAPRIVVVREGETLWRLARRHQVDLEALRQLNGLQDNHIVTGWTLRLPASAHAAGIHASGPRRMVR